MNQNVRKITEGAMMVAMYGIVLFINRQFAGLLETYFLVVLPIPLVVYSAKYGLRDSLVVCASVFFLSFMIATPGTWFYVLMSMVVGVTYGTLVKKQVKNGLLLSITMLSSIFSEVVIMILFAGFFGYSVDASLAELSQMISMVFDNAGLTLNMDMTKFVLMVFIMSIILLGVMEGALVHMLSNIILKRLKIASARPFKPLSQWIVPKWTGYVAFIAFSLGILSSYVKIEETILMVVLAMQMVGQIYLLVFGYIACLVYGATILGKNIAIYVILACLLLSTIMIPFLCVIGFFYISTDMREKMLARRKNNESKTNEN